MLSEKRMVVAAEQFLDSTGSGLAHGMRALGWDIQSVDSRIFFNQQRSAVLRAAARLTRPWVIRAYNETILTAIDQIKPQAFLTVKGIHLMPDTLKAMAARGVVSIMYYPDYHFDHVGLDRSILPMFDLFATTKSFQLEYLRGIMLPERVALVHHGFNDPAHYPRSQAVGEADYVADVSYVGNYSPYKEKWLKAIANRLPQVHLRLIGSRWDLAQDPALKKCVVGYVMTGDMHARAVQHSRINIAIHGGPHQPEGWEDFVSTRTFEIPACKGFMLHIDNAEVRSMFEPGREIDVFANEDRLIERIEYYLARPALRAEMVERAHARCVPAYGYNARAREISTTLAPLLEKRRIGGGSDPTAAVPSASVSAA